MSRRMKWILGIGIPVCGILLAAGALIVIYLKLHVIEPVRFRFDYTDTGYVGLSPGAGRRYRTDGRGNLCRQ